MVLPGSKCWSTTEHSLFYHAQPLKIPSQKPATQPCKTSELGSNDQQVKKGRRKKKEKANKQIQTPYISPHMEMETSWTGFSSRVRTFSILRTTSMPSTTLPKTTCLPFRCGAGAVRMKNWQPLVLGPEFCCDDQRESVSHSVQMGLR